MKYIKNLKKECVRGLTTVYDGRPPSLSLVVIISQSIYVLFKRGISILHHVFDIFENSLLNYKITVTSSELF